MRVDVAIAAAAETLAAAPMFTASVVAAPATARITGKSHGRSASGEAKYKEAKELRRRACYPSLTAVCPLVCTVAPA